MYRKKLEDNKIDQADFEKTTVMFEQCKNASRQ